jgi:hypothetical protein
MKFAFLCKVMVSLVFGLGENSLYSHLTLYPIDLKVVKTHIDNKLKNAKVELDPFPHIIIHDILPDQLYQDLLSHWPDNNAFDTSNNQYRRRLPVTNGCAEARKDKISEMQINFWRTFGEIIAKYIKSNVIELLLPYLNLRFPHADQERLTYIRDHMRFFHGRRDGLVIDFEGYELGPHIDNIYFFAAVLLYCPSDTQHLDCGTAFYNSIHTGIDNHSVQPDWKRTDFHLQKIAPFAPNTLVVVMQTPSAWHGVEKMHYPSYVRKMYLTDIYIDFDYLKELYPDFFKEGGSPASEGIPNYSPEFLYNWDATFLNPQVSEYSSK